MMHYQSTLRDFNTEWTAIVKLSNESAPKVPTLTNTNTPLRWCESFKNIWYNTFGVRTVPLSYIIRDEVEVTPETGDDLDTIYDSCLAKQAHGVSGSIL